MFFRSTNLVCALTVPSSFCFLFLQSAVSEIREEINEQKLTSTKRDAHYTQLEVSLAQKSAEAQELQAEVEKVPLHFIPIPPSALPLLSQPITPNSIT